MLTHHTRPSFSLGDTTFHFLDASPERALAVAQEAADGKDVRLGGGVTTVREFIAADLEGRYEHESVLSPSGTEHHFFWR